jgi:hypothetical protein
VVRSATATVPSPAPVVNAVPINATANRLIAAGFRITTGMSTLPLLEVTDF